MSTGPVELLGYRVYVIDADQGVKIGITFDLAARVRELGRASGQPMRVVRSYPMTSRAHARRVEQDAHWLLRDTRTVGEWFHCHPFDATAAVEHASRRGADGRPVAPLAFLAQIEEERAA